MRVNARVEVNMHTAEMVTAGREFAREFVEEVARDAMGLAMRNVDIGSGPGPHPHRPGSGHIDTGQLRNSINVRRGTHGGMETATVYTDEEYGLFLEMGWTNPYSGNHWRYPWLYPAMQEAMEDWESVAQSTGRRWFSATGTASIGKKIISTPLSATWLPEVG